MIRDYRSDALRALAIVGVVLIHAKLPGADAFRFCVPVFITIWAYYYEIGLQRRTDGWPYTRHRFMQLVPAFVVWTLIYVFLFNPLNAWQTTPLRTIIGGWFGGAGWPGQYFVVILFQLTLLLPFLRQFVTPNTLASTVVAGLMLNGIAGWFFFHDAIVARIGHRFFIYWIPYAVLGIAFARGYLMARPIYVVGILALLAAPAEINYLSKGNAFASPYLLWSVSVGSAALLMSLAARRDREKQVVQSEKSPVSALVALIGQNSFPIFVANPLFLFIARPLEVWFGDAVLWMLVGKCTLTVLAIAGSLALASILRWVGLGLLVGK